jgi:hypothetical protein
MGSPSRADSQQASAQRAATWASWLVLSVALVAGLLTVGDYGVTTDETLRMRAADGWAKAIAAGEVEAFAIGSRAQYGVLFDQLGRLAWLLDRALPGGTDEFAARHLLCFITGWLGLVGTWALARRLGPPWLASLAVLLLVLAPRYWGVSFANPKDVPFATTWVWAMWACVRAVQHPSRRATLWVAITAGLCATVRSIGVVFFLVGAACIIAPIVPGGLRGRRTIWRRALREVVIACLLAYAIVYVTWPVLWVHSPWHLVSNALELTRHPFGSRSLFLGELHPHDDAPALYAAVWIAITLPVPTVLAAIGGAITRVRLLVHQLRAGAHPVERWLPWLLVLGWALGPMVVPAVRTTTLYDTSRQLTFVLPAIALLAADGLLRAFARIKDRRARAAGIAVVALAYLDVLARMIALHPYSSLYFNRAVGGLRGAQGRFDVAHYSETYAEGFAWLREHADPGAHVHVLGNGSTTASYYSWKHGTTLNTPTFEYFMSEVRQGWEDTLPGEVVHTIDREDTPLLVIKRVAPIAAARVAWSWSHAKGDPAEPPRPPPSSMWQPVPVAAGQIVLDALMQPGDPLVLSIPIEVDATTTTRFYLRYYHGLRVWLADRLLWDAEAVPFAYRGSHRFPSLVPLDVALEPGQHWIHIELDRIYVPWGFGLYAVQSPAFRFVVDEPLGVPQTEKP